MAVRTSTAAREEGKGNTSRERATKKRRGDLLLETTTRRTAPPCKRSKDKESNAAMTTVFARTLWTGASRQLGRQVCTRRPSAPLDRRWFSSSKATTTNGSLPNDGRPSELPEEVEYVDTTLPRPILDPEKYKHEIPVRMPDMGEGGGKILRWYKQEGDVILREDVLCDIETKDFVFGMETDDEHPAIMGQILVEAPSEELADNQIICYLMHPTDQGEEEEKST
jgi:hypothetical protein